MSDSITKLIRETVHTSMNDGMYLGADIAIDVIKKQLEQKPTIDSADMVLIEAVIKIAVGEASPK